MEKPTEIYRFGHYVNTVPDNKESLRKWIMDNCSYERCEGAIPPTMTLLECIKIARERGYTFTSKVTDSISEQSVARLTKILAYAKFPEVATDLARCKRKGKNLVCSCPNCETGGSGGRTEKDISVTPRGITLLKGFRNKHPHTNRVALYFNDDGFLCFKFFGDDAKGCFSVCHQGKEGCTPVISLSTKFLDSHGIKVGNYNVREEDGYFVTDCKITPVVNHI